MDYWEKRYRQYKREWKSALRVYRLFVDEHGEPIRNKIRYKKTGRRKFKPDKLHRIKPVRNRDKTQSSGDKERLWHHKFYIRGKEGYWYDFVKVQYILNQYEKRLSSLIADLRVVNQDIYYCDTCFNRYRSLEDYNRDLDRHFDEIEKEYEYYLMIHNVKSTVNYSTISRKHLKHS